MRTLLALLFTILLASCIAIVPGEPLPQYVVLLTSSTPKRRGRCTGVAIDNMRVRTAYHCVDGPSGLTRVLTQDGQQSYVIFIDGDPLVDTAIVTLAFPIVLSEYARFSPPDYNEPADIFGACTHYMIHIPRHVSYLKQVETDIKYMGKWYKRKVDVWGSSDHRICGGDSGGVAIQNGSVIGFVSSVVPDVFPNVIFGLRVHIFPSVPRSNPVAR